ncbi:endonuclease/exonuclease/phosphatase family protein [Aestuariimicrobium ganziense]|uniref:endonuclease/exonuclease/phosphatase family protein n=1 Tax=Aestuariimicrobium ganziense TaxID=2773677 RepID=UPI0019415ABA|nr:hypothetical protein [Aestuariimicrobium ganziense]
MFAWDSTQRLADAGFVDVFRARYPDPVTHPGTTWPSDNAAVDDTAALTFAPTVDERDRIDYVFADPGVRVEGVGIVGPRGSIVRSQRVDEPHTDDFALVTDCWPSDHKAVLASFDLGQASATRD